MSYELLLPKKTMIGKGAVEKALPVWKNYGDRVFIVSDPGMKRLGNAQMLQDLLEQEGMKGILYSEICGEPTDEMIEEGFRLYKEEKCDHLIGFGGGSAIDAAKAIGALVTNGGCINDYMGKSIEKELPHLTAIPTTAGTGSEATQFTIINNTKDKVKMLLQGAALMPSLAVIDPRFTMTLPPAITASTGLDAFCHAVEAYTSRKATPLSDTFALSAYRRILKNLPAAYQDGNNAAAREEMAIAAFEAGIAFNNSSVTVVHGMSRPIGALFHIPHGTANAMLAEKCFTYVSDGTPERFGALYKVARPEENSRDIREAAGKFPEIVRELCVVCEIPTLAQYGIDKEEFMSCLEKMVHDAMESGSPQNTGKELLAEDLITIYRSLWN